MAFYDEALNYQAKHTENSEKYKHIRNAYALILIVGKGLETPDLRKKGIEWMRMTLDDMKVNERFIQRSLKG